MITVLARPGSVAVNSELELPEEEAHHLTVRRAADEEPLRVLDGAGALATGSLRWRGKRAVVAIATMSVRPAPPSLTLAVGAGDKERFGWLADKAAELGITDLVPLLTEHTGSVANRIRAIHVDKLTARARETLKQCGAAWAPRVHAPQSITDLLREPLPGLRWLAQPGGGTPPADLRDEAVTVVVGPEGGLTTGEIDHLLAARFTPVALAAPILRFETAALSAAAVIAAARLRGARD
jgi:16S rRNA (uracil1498-N3)-methyltransferase